MMEFRTEEESARSRSRRIWWVCLGFALLAGAVLVRAWQLQVGDAEEVLAKRDWRLETEEKVVAPRGQLRDRHGVLLAESVQAYNVYLDVRGLYGQFPDAVDSVRALLSTVPGFDGGVFDAWDAADPATLTRHHRVQRQMAPALWEQLEAAEKSLGINVFYDEPAYRRFYPEEELAGSLIGFVGSDGETGRSGLEAGLDETLRGETITYRVARDMRRKAYLFGDIPDLASASGEDVELTLDAGLQRFVERRLREVTEKYEAREAMAIVSRADSGELLAVASWPPFNPNHPFTFPDERIWVSHPLSHAYEPGSTAKIYTFAAALNEGLVSYDEPIDCEEGVIVIDGERVRDTHPEGMIPAWKVLQVSSNIGALKIGMRMSAETHYEYLRRFGLGERSALPVQGEGRGILKQPPWIGIHQANISFGHGFASTLLQSHMATSVIANDGVLMEPMIVRAIHHRDGTVEWPKPRVRHRAVSSRVAREVARAMEQVVEHEDGTGKAAAVDGVRVAGKTGTANLVNPNGGGYIHEFLSSFSGFVPADDPRFVVSVWVLEPNTQIDYFGGRVAAPAFGAIAEETLRRYASEEADERPRTLADAVARFDQARVRDADATGGTQISAAAGAEAAHTAPSTVAERTDVPAGAIPDFRGMWARQALALAERHNLDIELRGTGQVVAQSIAPGESPDGVGGRVLLRLGSEEGRDATR